MSLIIRYVSSVWLWPIASQGQYLVRFWGFSVLSVNTNSHLFSADNNLHQPLWWTPLGDRAEVREDGPNEGNVGLRHFIYPQLDLCLPPICCPLYHFCLRVTELHLWFCSWLWTNRMLLLSNVLICRDSHLCKAGLTAVSLEKMREEGAGWCGNLGIVN